MRFGMGDWLETGEYVSDRQYCSDIVMPCGFTGPVDCDPTFGGVRYASCGPQDSTSGGTDVFNLSTASSWLNSIFNPGIGTTATSASNSVSVSPGVLALIAVVGFAFLFSRR